MITAERLRELLHYEPQTGEFTRRVAMSGRGASVGDIAGKVTKKGYREISVGGSRHKAHRLAWLYMTGEWPKDQIDHVNLNKGDNRWCNLREADNSKNRANTPPPSTSTSGYKGAHWGLKTPDGRGCRLVPRNAHKRPRE
ncbi:MAG: HNH endonuclease [Beijerinckiaceae bacterium]|nr:MAG: HNH endonuclease [Beijerinckiaceae bacterium]